jgi:hypothetical protein
MRRCAAAAARARGAGRRAAAWPSSRRGAHRRQLSHRLVAALRGAHVELLHAPLQHLADVLLPALGVLVVVVVVVVVVVFAAAAALGG